MKPTRIISIIMAMLFVAMFASCGNKHNSPAEANMPKFEPKFPQKSVWVHLNSNDSIKIMFSSMEEAEWNLLHVAYYFDFIDAFEKVLLSDPSSMDYPFALFTEDEMQNDIYPPIYSEDSLVRCIGLKERASFVRRAESKTQNMPYQPMMMIQYRVNDKVGLANKLEQYEDFYYGLQPDTIFTFNMANSILYFVWGYSDDTTAGDGYRLRAYELDTIGLHPAFVFEKEHLESYGLGNEQSLFTVNGECDKENNDVDVKSLAYFDKDKATIYIREFKVRERYEGGCSPYLTNRYWKYVWNGKLFVLKGTIDNLNQH